MRPVVEAVQAMRGVGLIVAVTVVAEVGDFSRFQNPRQLMAYLGLVPSEHSSGANVHKGGITKAGNALARRVVMKEHGPTACPRVSARNCMRGWRRCPRLCATFAWKAQLRLCNRYRRLAASGKAKAVVTTAIAREMVGFIWAIARHVQEASTTA